MIENAIAKKSALSETSVDKKHYLNQIQRDRVDFDIRMDQWVKDKKAQFTAKPRVTKRDQAKMILMEKLQQKGENYCWQLYAEYKKRISLLTKEDSLDQAGVIFKQALKKFDYIQSYYEQQLRAIGAAEHLDMEQKQHLIQEMLAESETEKTGAKEISGWLSENVVGYQQLATIESSSKFSVREKAEQLKLFIDKLQANQPEQVELINEARKMLSQNLETQIQQTDRKILRLELKPYEKNLDKMKQEVEAMHRLFRVNLLEQETKETVADWEKAGLAELDYEQVKPALIKLKKQNAQSQLQAIEKMMAEKKDYLFGWYKQLFDYFKQQSSHNQQAGDSSTANAQLKRILDQDIKKYQDQTSSRLKAEADENSAHGLWKDFSNREDILDRMETALNVLYGRAVEIQRQLRENETLKAKKNVIVQQLQSGQESRRKLFDLSAVAAELDRLVFNDHKLSTEQNKGRFRSKVADFFGKLTKERTTKNIQESGQPDLEQQAQSAVEQMSHLERKEISWGIDNVGIQIKKQANGFMAKCFESIESMVKQDGKLIQEQNILIRYLNSIAGSYHKDSDVAQERLATLEKEKQAGLDKRIWRDRLENLTYLPRKIAGFGRIVVDVIGSVSSPLRYVSMAGATFARQADAMKEARFKNEQLIDKTRIQDIEKAAEVAWQIYEQVKNSNETSSEVTKEKLQQAYQQQLPRDVLARLQKDYVPGTSFRLAKEVVKYDLLWSVERIIENLEKVDKQTAWTNEQKEARKRTILNQHSRHLTDLDSLVSQHGTIDALALAARYLNVAGKTVVGGVMVESFGLAVKHLWDALPEHWSRLDAIGQQMMKLFESKDSSPTTIGQTVSISVEPEVIEQKTPELSDKVQESMPKPKPLDPELEQHILDKATDTYSRFGTDILYDPKIVDKLGIWADFEKQMITRFGIDYLTLGKGDLATAQALKTKNQSLIQKAMEEIIISKDRELIKSAGLSRSLNLWKISDRQKAKINWAVILDKAFGQKGLVTNISLEEQQSIMKNNQMLQRFFHDNPQAPRTDKNIQAILEGKGRKSGARLASIKIFNKIVNS